MSWRETKIKRLIKIYVIKVSLISEINKICAYQKSIGGDSVLGFSEASRGLIRLGLKRVGLRNNGI